MKIVALILALMAAASGLWAAYRWYRASRVRFVAFDDMNGRPVPDLEARLTAQGITMREVGLLNEKAAVWSAVSISLTGLSAVAGALAHA